MKHLLALSFCAMILMACSGDEITYITERNQTVGKLDAGEKLGKCTPEMFGETVYVVDSAAVFFCDENAWVRMTFAYEKDTVVIRDSVIVVEADSGCSFQILDGKTYTLVCESDTLWFDKKDPVVAPSVIEDGKLIDSRDGSKYGVVRLGERTWMAENLNYAGEGSWCYENDKSMCEKYGRLYTFADAKNGCPVGWHLPSKTEWEELVDLIQEAQKLDKWSEVVPYLISATGWSGVESSGSYGFSAYPAGTKKYSDSSFYGAGDETNFWAADGSCLMIKSGSLVIENHDAEYGFSVRCVKN